MVGHRLVIEARDDMQVGVEPALKKTQSSLIGQFYAEASLLHADARFPGLLGSL